MINTTQDINGQELNRRLVNLGLNKSIVKLASVKDVEEYPTLEGNQFADRLNRDYPTNTKSATERSIVYYFGSDVDSDVIEGRIKRAARFWDCIDTFYTVKQAKLDSVGLKEDQNEVSEYALNGNKLPISTLGQTEKSAATLVAARNRIPREKRASAALSILRALVDFDSSSKHMPEIQKMAGVRTRDTESIAKDLRLRGYEFEQRGVDTEIYKIASEGVRGCTAETLDDLCSLIDTFEHTKSASRVKTGPIEDIFYTSISDEESIKVAGNTLLNLAHIKQAGAEPFYSLGETVPLEVSAPDGSFDIKRACQVLTAATKDEVEVFEKCLKTCLV